LYLDAFLLYNVLQEQECKYYIEKSDELGYKHLNWDLINRVNYRLMINSPELSEIIWNRIEPYLKNLEIVVDSLQNTSTTPLKDNGKKKIILNLKGIEYLGAADGVWTPIRLNTRFRLCRYNPGGKFGAHYDGSYVEDEEERSLLTFMIYLNVGYKGGHTNFLDDSTVVLSMAKGSGEDSVCVVDEKTKKITATVGPLSPGVAVIFPQDLLHEGSKLEEGVKYIMRSDIICQREKFSDDHLRTLDKEKEARRLLRLAEELEKSNKADKAVKYYKKAFNMSESLAKEYHYG